jgi:glycosyltransferase involved in cell wall biosynthesis
MIGANAHPVLHCVADWGLPSERFVVDLVRTTTLTRPAVACGRRHDEVSDAAVPVSALLPYVGRLPYRFRRPATRQLLVGVALRRRSRLLHAHFGYWAAHTAAVARRRRVPWVLSLHGYDLLVMHGRDPEADQVHDADLVIVPSRFLADAAVARGFPADRIHVVPSGIDVDAYPFRARALRADGAVRVTFAGRFVAKKGVLDAAEAMAAAARTTTLVCRFVGYGPLEGDLRAALSRLGLAAEVVDGSAPGALRSILDDTDVLVSPSKTAADGDAESLGLVNIEAQASGIPVVTTAHGGIPEAVSADGAVLVPEGDLTALTTALVTVASAPERWTAMGAAGSDHARRRFRLRDRVRDIEELYLQLIETSAHRSRAQRRRSRP